MALHSGVKHWYIVRSRAGFGREGRDTLYFSISTRAYMQLQDAELRVV